MPIDDTLRKKIISTAYGEARGDTAEGKANFMSSLLRRFDDFPTGAYPHFDSYDKMLEGEYYAIPDAVEGKNEGYLEAMNYFAGTGEIAAPKDQAAMKELMQLYRGMLRGTVPIKDVQFIIEKDKVGKNPWLKNTVPVGSYVDSQNIAKNLYSLPMESWETQAVNDPLVREWWKQLNEKYPQNEPLLSHLRESRDYDYGRAYRGGIRPGLDEESGELHWKDILGEPTAENVMKSGEHKTVQYAIDELPFQEAFKFARENNKKEFVWRGNRYTTKVK